MNTLDIFHFFLLSLPVIIVTYVINSISEDILIRMGINLFALIWFVMIFDLYNDLQRRNVFRVDWNGVIEVIIKLHVCVVFTTIGIRGLTEVTSNLLIF